MHRTGNCARNDDLAMVRVYHSVKARTPRASIGAAILKGTYRFSFQSGNSMAPGLSEQNTLVPIEPVQLNSDSTKWKLNVRLHYYFLCLRSMREMQ